MKLLKNFTKLIVILCFVLTTTFIIYALNYYKATDEAYTYLSESTQIDKNIYYDGTKDIGIIIYPGAKVEHVSYTLLAKKLAEKGYTVVIAKFPLRFAFLDKNVANDIINKRKNIDRWVIVGHSLGGVMASSYAKNEPKIEKIVYLASYPASSDDIKSLYIYGSNDNVLSKEKINSDSVKIISGGNHAGFGLYGPQKGDGELQIKKGEQIRQTVEFIDEFIEWE